jgi:hypothetical protein
MRFILRSVLLALTSVTLGMAVTGEADAQRADALLQRAADITDKVVKLRGLAKKREIARGIMDRDAIGKRLLQRIDEEYTAEELVAEELVLKRLGLLPPEADYKQLVIDLFAEQIAGFYDPADSTLYIADVERDDKAGLDDILMAHEIDHALQDQHFGLGRFMKPIKNQGDATTARQALVEGDGTALMFEYMMKNLGKDVPWADSRATDAMIEQMSLAVAQQGFEHAPLVLRETMLFPYMNGLGFVAHFRKHHPWSEVDRIYKKPPLSTEHILHPETYVDYERPDEVTVGAIRSLAGYTEVYDNVSGEFGLSILLRQHTGSRMKQRGAVHGSKQKAARATAGWGGDRVALYTPPGHDGASASTVAVLYTVWDEVADAIEFFEMLSDAMPSLSGGNALAGTDVETLYRDAAGREYLASRREHAVIIVLGASTDQARTIVGEVSKTWKVRRR